MKIFQRNIVNFCVKKARFVLVQRAYNKWENVYAPEL